jgi:hypothetical protein
MHGPSIIRLPIISGVRVSYPFIGGNGFGVMISDANDDLWVMAAQGDPDGGIWKFDTTSYQWAWYAPTTKHTISIPELTRSLLILIFPLLLAPIRTMFMFPLLICQSPASYLRCTGMVRRTVRRPFQAPRVQQVVVDQVVAFGQIWPCTRIRSICGVRAHHAMTQQ